MKLEEKIAALPLDLRIRVEEYVDFLQSRRKNYNQTISQDFSMMTGVMDDEVPDWGSSEVPPAIPVPPETPVSHSPPSGVRGRTDSSGIILAEEQAVEHENSDYVDFADINSRFGHMPKEEEEQKGSSRLRRLLDWM